MEQGLKLFFITKITYHFFHCNQFQAVPLQRKSNSNFPEYFARIQVLLNVGAYRQG